MKDTIIGRQIRRCNRNLLLANLGVIALLLMLLVGNQRYLYNCIAGPFPISADQIQDVGFGTKKEFFVISDLGQATDTGVYIAHTRNGREESREHIYVALAGDRFFLIKSSSSSVSSPYRGVLSFATQDIRSLFNVELKKDGSEFHQRFMPYMLILTNYRFEAYVSFAIGLVVLALCLYNVKNALLRIEDPTHSPVYHAVARYGDNVDELATAVHTEATASDVQKYGAFTLTRSWLLHKTFFSFTPFHLYDIVWLYTKQTQHYSYFIPTGKSHAIVIADMIGRTAEADLGRGKSKQKNTETFIAELRSRIPWVMAGYSKDLENLYKKHLSDFVTLVSDARRESESVASSVPPPLD